MHSTANKNIFSTSTFERNSFQNCTHEEEISNCVVNIIQIYITYITKRVPYITVFFISYKINS